MIWLIKMLNNTYLLFRDHCIDAVLSSYVVIYTYVIVCEVVSVKKFYN